MMEIQVTKEILTAPGMPASPLFKRTYKAIQNIDEKPTKLILGWRFIRAVEM
ncbi:hypothetical protein [Serratia nevei]|uniref:hypothetical protein n=1 Tax=Serratia nevei TaxID=2703794 RepID=UPI00313DE02E